MEVLGPIIMGIILVGLVVLGFALTEGHAHERWKAGGGEFLPTPTRPPDERGLGERARGGEVRVCHTPGRAVRVGVPRVEIPRRTRWRGDGLGHRRFGGGGGALDALRPRP